MLVYLTMRRVHVIVLSPIILEGLVMVMCVCVCVCVCVRTFYMITLCTAVLDFKYESL